MHPGQAAFGVDLVFRASPARVRAHFRMETVDLAAPLVLDRRRYTTILRLALPTVVAMLSQSVVNEIDVVFFSHLPCPESSNGQAALLPSLILLWLFGGSLSALSEGTRSEEHTS